MSRRRYLVALTRAELCAAARALAGIAEMSEPADHPRGVHAAASRALAKLRQAMTANPGDGSAQIPRSKC